MCRLPKTGGVTTRNVARPGNVAKKALPENVANFVGGYTLFGNLIPKNVTAPENIADTDPTGNVATTPENVAAVDPTGNVATSPENVAGMHRPNDGRLTTWTKFYLLF